MTPHHLPFYIAKPGETDVLMIVMGIFLILTVLAVGNLCIGANRDPRYDARRVVALLGNDVLPVGAPPGAVDPLAQVSCPLARMRAGRLPGAGRHPIRPDLLERRQPGRHHTDGHCLGERGR